MIEAKKANEVLTKLTREATEEKIKEILEELEEHSDSKNVAPFELIDIECKLLLDYITNLQKENKMYAQLKDEYEDIINKATKLLEKKENKYE